MEQYYLKYAVVFVENYLVYIFPVETQYCYIEQDISIELLRVGDLRN